MAELKTKPTDLSVAKFLASIKEEDIRDDCRSLAKLMSQATGSRPKMWGSSIVGFGSCRLRYASGRELDWFTTGFSPRKNNITLYVVGGYSNHKALLDKLGRHSLGKGCLYLKGLDEVNLPALKKLVQKTVKAAPKYQHYA